MTDASIGRIEALWEKLRRRKVVQWGLAYGLFAWGLLQGLEYLTDTFVWPPLLQQLATLAFLIGLPIVLVVAWYHGDRGEQQIQAAEFLILCGLLLLGGTLFWWFGTSAVSSSDRGDGPHPNPGATDRSIAVLPFDNLSGDPANEFLGDGLAEELANLLTRIPDLDVASRTSAFSYKGRKVAICEIATELGVKYLVEGSLRRNGDTLAITAQLIECPRGTHAWSKTYRRLIADLPNVEQEITESVAEALKIILQADTLERVRRRSEVSQDGYQLYLQAVSELRNFAEHGSLDRSIERFQQATSADPTYAHAYAGLCEAHVQRYRKEKTVRDVGDAENACAQAVKLDRGLPEVHAALGMLYYATGQDDIAEREYRRAIELDANNVDAQLGLGAVLKSKGDIEAAERCYQDAIRLRSRYWRAYDAYGGFLYELGRWPEAVKQFRRGVELAPQNAQPLNNLGGVLFLSGDFDAAADAFRRSVEITPTSQGYSNTGTNYYYAGRYRDAVAMFEQATRLAPEDHALWGNLGDAYRRTPGQGDLARAAFANAADLARGALRVNPDSAATRTTLAYYLARQGKASEAATELSTAGATPDGDLYSHYYAALVYKELGNLAAAVAETRKAVQYGYPATLLRADPEFAVILNDKGLAAEIMATRKSSD